MLKTRRLAETIALRAAALRDAVTGRLRQIASALARTARDVYSGVLRAYVSFEGAFCVAVVKGIELVWVLRQFVYILAPPVLITAAAIYFSRWWLWMVSIAWCSLIVVGLRDMRHQTAAQPEPEVFPEWSRRILERFFMGVLRVTCLLVSAVLAWKTASVTVPVLVGEFNELRRRATQETLEGSVAADRAPLPVGATMVNADAKASIPVPVSIPSPRPAEAVRSADVAIAPPSKSEGSSAEHGDGQTSNSPLPTARTFSVSSVSLSRSGASGARAVSTPAPREESEEPSPPADAPLPSERPDEPPSALREVPRPTAEDETLLRGLRVVIVWGPFQARQARSLQAPLESMGAAVSFAVADEGRETRISGIYATRSQHSRAEALARAIQHLVAERLLIHYEEGDARGVVIVLMGRPIP